MVEGKGERPVLFEGQRIVEEEKQIERCKKMHVPYATIRCQPIDESDPPVRKCEIYYRTEHFSLV